MMEGVCFESNGSTSESRVMWHVALKPSWKHGAKKKTYVENKIFDSSNVWTNLIDAECNFFIGCIKISKRYSFAAKNFLQACQIYQE